MLLGLGFLLLGFFGFLKCFYLSHRRAQAPKPAQVVPHKLTKIFGLPLWYFAAHSGESSNPIQARQRHSAAQNCSSAARSITSNYTCLSFGCWEGETMNLLTASGRAGQDTSTQEIVCPQLSLFPPYTFFLGWNTTVAGYGWPHCNNFQSPLNKRAPSLLPPLLSKEGARTAWPSDRLTSLLAVLCALMHFSLTVLWSNFVLGDH